MRSAVVDAEIGQTGLGEEFQPMWYSDRHTVRRPKPASRHGLGVVRDRRPDSWLCVSVCGRRAIRPGFGYVLAFDGGSRPQRGIAGYLDEPGSRAGRASNGTVSGSASWRTGRDCRWSDPRGNRHRPWLEHRIGRVSGCHRTSPAALPPSPGVRHEDRSIGDETPAGCYQQRLIPVDGQQNGPPDCLPGGPITLVHPRRFERRTFRSAI